MIDDEDRDGVLADNDESNRHELAVGEGEERELSALVDDQACNQKILNEKRSWDTK